jgi:hypothetical protein
MKIILGFALFFLLAGGFEGKWLTDGGPERAIFEFQVDGSKLTGTLQDSTSPTSK